MKLVRMTSSICITIKDSDIEELKKGNSVGTTQMSSTLSDEIQISIIPEKKVK